MLMVPLLYGQSLTADAVLGTWRTGKGNGQVMIYRNGNAFDGRIVWLKEPNDPATGLPRTDRNNPEPSLRNRPLLGLVNAWGFRFDGRQEWEGGRIYDPESGNQYRCYLKLRDANTLLVRGYVGVSLFGRTDTWTRVQGH